MISLVLPTRNRADLLAATLESVTRQSLPPSEFEVIVVDNGSTDRTPQVVAEFGSRLPTLRRIFEAEPGLHVGRHAGMRAAHSDVIVFGDDDIEAFPTWLESIAQCFVDPDTVMAGGNIPPMYLAEPPAWIRKLWERRDASGRRAIPQLSVMEMPLTSGFVSPEIIWGCNLAIRKAALLEAGGFHPDGMPKDLIRLRGDGETHISRYVAARGWKCAFRASASVHHKVTPGRMTFDYFRERGFTQGISDSYTALRQRHGDDRYDTPGFVERAMKRAVRDFRDWRDGADVRTAQRETLRGRRKGFAYHQQAYRDDPDVRNWVHRPDYFNAGPHFASGSEHLVKAQV